MMPHCNAVPLSVITVSGTSAWNASASRYSWRHRRLWPFRFRNALAPQAPVATARIATIDGELGLRPVREGERQRQRSNSVVKDRTKPPPGGPAINSYGVAARSAGSTRIRQGPLPFAAYLQSGARSGSVGP
jgi:hypothetical protein